MKNINHTSSSISDDIRNILCSFFFSSRRRHTRSKRDWSSDVCSSDLPGTPLGRPPPKLQRPRPVRVIGLGHPAAQDPSLTARQQHDAAEVRLAGPELAPDDAGSVDDEDRKSVV